LEGERERELEREGEREVGEGLIAFDAKQHEAEEREGCFLLVMFVKQGKSILKRERKRDGEREDGEIALVTASIRNSLVNC
jgi:hypothetical protein